MWSPGLWSPGLWSPSAGQGSGTLLLSPLGALVLPQLPAGTAQPRCQGWTQHKDRFLSPAFIPADSSHSFKALSGKGEYKINNKKGVGVRGQLGGSGGFSSSSSSVSSSSVPPTSWPAPWPGSPR